MGLSLFLFLSLPVRVDQRGRFESNKNFLGWYILLRGLVWNRFRRVYGFLNVDSIAKPFGFYGLVLVLLLYVVLVRIHLR